MFSNTKLNVKYQPIKDGIGDLLIKTPSTYSKEEKERILVSAKRRFENVTDMSVGRNRRYGEMWYVDRKRLEVLQDNDLVEVIKFE